jgi:hypothetical protein
MRRAFILAAALLVGAVTHAVAAENPNVLTAKEKAEGWNLLFNGTSLDGWHGHNLPGPPAAGWAIEEGLLKTVPKVTGKALVTDRKYIDFELKWEWRLAPGANNGVKYFVSEARAAAPGHEYQMIDDQSFADGKLGPLHLTGAFYDVLPPAKDAPVRKAGEWNQSRIVVKGNHVEHWLNGKQVVAYELGSEAVKAGLAKSKFAKYADFGAKIQGPIMLTYHNDECWYRNIKMRELPAH